jgi:hypothetical protein
MFFLLTSDPESGMLVPVSTPGNPKDALKIPIYANLSRLFQVICGMGKEHRIFTRGIRCSFPIPSLEQDFLTVPDDFGKLMDIILKK